MSDPRAMEDSALQASLFLKALANQNRLLILCHLAEAEMSVSDLEQVMRLRQPTLSQQLARLREDGLVDTRRDGKMIYYRLASEAVRRMIGLLYELFCSPKATDGMAHRPAPAGGTTVP